MAGLGTGGDGGPPNGGQKARFGWPRVDPCVSRAKNLEKRTSNHRDYSGIGDVAHETERLAVLKHRGSRNPRRTCSRAPFNGENRFSSFPDGTPRVRGRRVSISSFAAAINLPPTPPPALASRSKSRAQSSRSDTSGREARREAARLTIQQTYRSRE